MKTEWNTVDLQTIKQKLVDKLTLAGEVVVSAAIQKCPVDTGNLRGSINSEVDEGKLSVRIGTPVEYAPYIEFGTGEHAENGKGRKDWKGMKAQPFLRPALIENKEKIREIMNAT